MVAVAPPVVSVVGKIGAVSGADIVADPTVAAAFDAKADTADLADLVPYAGAVGDVDLNGYQLFGGNLGHFEGALVDPVITDNGDSTVDISSVECMIRTHPTDPDANRLRVTVPAATAVPLTPDVTNYLVVDYGSGSPYYDITLDQADLSLSRIPVARMFVEGGVVTCKLAYGAAGRSTPGRHLYREALLSYPTGARRESGLTLSETPTRVLTVAGGVVWFVLARTILDEITMGDAGVQSELIHHVGGAWTRSVITQYDNLYYDDGTDLVAAGNNKYVVNWVFRSIGADHIGIVLGRANYTFAEAVASGVPPVPQWVSEFCWLAGRIIVEKGATSAALIENNVSGASFVGTPAVSIHNNLDGLQGGQVGEYYHLTDDEYTELSAGYVPYTGATSTVDLETQSLYAGNVSYNEGVLSDPTITDAAGVAIALTSVDVLIRDDANWGTTARLYRATVPAVASLAVTDDALNYIYVDWNGGSPIYAATTDRDLLNHSNRIPAARIYMSSGDIEYQLAYGALARGAAVRNVDRIYRTRGVAGAEREQGLALSEAATRLVVVGSGFAWTGLRRISLDSATMGGVGVTSHLWYHSAGVWTEATITQYGNTQYDDGTNLVTLTANRYAVNWVYRALGGLEIDIVLGGGDYTLAQAEASTQPPIPPAILGFYVLVGRIIVQKGASSATAIESVVNTTFNQQAVSIHNDLSSLQGGTVGEYYHLTSAQYSALGTATSITSGTPASGGAAGTAGQILYDANRLYVCVAANTWKYVDLTALP